MPRPPESSDRIFLVVIVEFDPATAGRALEALHAEHVTALRLPHLSHLPLAYERMHPRVLVVDSKTPGTEELETVRTMRLRSAGGTLTVVLLGEAEPASLPPPLCELTDVYVRKPADWHKVARTVIQLANNRRPPSDVVILRQA